MQWTDEGIVLGTRRHGETSLILELMTRGHGRHLGLVRGGRSRRLQPVLQPGNTVRATWRARLDEHLGNYTRRGDDAARRAADRERRRRSTASRRSPRCSASCRSAIRIPQLYDGLRGDARLARRSAVVAGALIVRFELQLLEELGFGLDLERCAATGSNDDLAYVSPKTGRAVSRSAGEPYRDRLLRAAARSCSSAVGAPPAPTRHRRCLPADRLFPGPPRLRAARPDRIRTPAPVSWRWLARPDASRGGAIATDSP